MRRRTPAPLPSHPRTSPLQPRPPSSSRSAPPREGRVWDRDECDRPNVQWSDSGCIPSPLARAAAPLLLRPTPHAEGSACAPRSVQRLPIPEEYKRLFTLETSSAQNNNLDNTHPLGEKVHFLRAVRHATPPGRPGPRDADNRHEQKLKGRAGRGVLQSEVTHLCLLSLFTLLLLTVASSIFGGAAQPHAAAQGIAASPVLLPWPPLVPCLL